MSIDPGRLKTRLVIEAPVETADDMGGLARTYIEAATVWAEVTPLGARADVSAEASGAVASYRVLLRAGPELTTRHRLREGARLFTVLSIIARDDRLLEVRAQERID